MNKCSERTLVRMDRHSSCLLNTLQHGMYRHIFCCRWNIISHHRIKQSTYDETKNSVIMCQLPLLWELQCNDTKKYVREFMSYVTEVKYVCSDHTSNQTFCSYNKYLSLSRVNKYQAAAISCC